MSGTDFKRLEEVYEAALDRSPNERDAFVADACAGNPGLRRRVERMLADAEQASQFLETPPFEIPGAPDDPGRRDPLLGQRVGRYQILRIIGVGGMGVVYEAWQENPGRGVALKLLRPGWIARSLPRRFQREADLLGRLRHPAVAQIYEAGTVEIAGVVQPFFAMELVEGRSITRYADEHGLGPRERLSLLAAVCDGVEHAHQRGIVHRDLKPGNILVDEGGRPKILDFGVARATDSDVQVTTMRTEAGQIVGTISYMSPEQARGRSEELDRRSDVYSLGVVLFELLSGRLPHDVGDRPIAEAVRAITEDDPTHLSTIDRSLRGDIETIVAKALERDRMRRYQSAAALADDIRAYLADEPIAARPASTFYQLGKFAKRNKGLVAAVGTAFFILVGSLVAVSILAIRAEVEQAKTKAMNDVLRMIVTAADPYPSTRRGTRPLSFGGNARVVDVLVEAIQWLDANPMPDQLAEAEIRSMMGMSLFGVGRFEEGKKNSERALAIFRSRVGEDDTRTIESKIALSYNLGHLFDLYESARLANEAVDSCVRRHGGENEQTLRALHALWVAYLYLGYAADAESVAARMQAIFDKNPQLDYMGWAIKAFRAKLMVNELHLVNEGKALTKRAIAEGEAQGDGNTNLMGFAYTVLGDAESYQGENKAAAEHYQHGVDLWAAASGDIPAIEFRSILGVIISKEEGQETRGIQILTDAVEAARKQFGGDAPLTARILGRLAFRQWDFGQLDGAEANFRQQAAIVDRASPVNVPSNAQIHWNLGRFLAEVRHQPREAEAEYRRALEIAETLPEAWDRYSWDDRRIAASLAVVLHRQGRDHEAQPYYSMIRARLDHPSDPWDAFYLASDLLEVGQYDLAEPIARQSIDGFRHLQAVDEAPITSRFIRTLDLWASALDGQGHVEAAEAAWREADAIWEPFDGSHAIALRYAACLGALGKFNEAERILLRTIRELTETAASAGGLRAETAADALLEVRAATADMYAKWGKPERAAEFRQPGAPAK